MENKKIDVLFGVVVIAFLLVTIIIIKDFKNQRNNDTKEFKAVVANIVRMKNDKIRSLSNQLAEQIKENQSLSGVLSATRNDLDSLSKKLAQQAPIPVPAAAPAPTAPATVAAK